MNAVPSNTPNAYRTPLHIVVTLIGVSALASAFLFWLVFYHSAIDAAGSHLTFLPALNAALNFCCTVALLVGFMFIWRQQILRHRNAMFVAFFFSTLFLVCYIANYFLHGESHFPLDHQTAHFIYIWILLVPHILASVVALPMILITFFFSLSGRFALHRRIARYTFPLWLYVSVSGVVVYIMQAVYRS
jgi:putative membrane protein